LLSVALAAACAHAPAGRERDPSGAGRPWHEYRSAHFVLDTNLPRGAAAALVGTLERLRDLELRALQRHPDDVPGTLRVVVPATPRAYAELAPPFSSGYFTLGWLVVPTIVVPARALGRAPEVVAHELAHALSRFLFPAAPTWFDEGLAQFVETIANPDPRYERTVGLAPRLVGSRLAEASPVPARELLAWTGSLDHHEEVDRHHVYSWLLFHYLWSERSRGLEEYRRRLAAAEEPRAAWRAAFPDLDPDVPGALERLDAALAAHRAKGAVAGVRVAASPVDAAFTEAPLGPAEVRMLLLEVRSDRAVAAREVKEALRDDPGHPVALWLAEQDGLDRKAALRASAPRRSDWRGWLLLAMDLDADAERAEKEEALRRAIALQPGSALAHDELARVRVAAGRADEAYLLARRAVDLAPFVPAFTETLARVALERGDCGEALALQRRAAAMAAGAAAGTAASTLRAYEERCRAAADGGN
jgi:tetratricopeptide (TPR) repeat protein